MTWQARSAGIEIELHAYRELRQPVHQRDHFEIAFTANHVTRRDEILKAPLHFQVYKLSGDVDQ